MPLEIIRNDITKMHVDAIVNAANIALQMGGGVCGAIFSAAGAEKLQAECDQIGHCDVGDAVITSGYDLPAKYIIHAVGPIWDGGNANEAQLLRSCYENALYLARQHQCESIAFPLISSGIYGYPKDQALQIAISEIGEFLLKNEMKVYLVIYDKKGFALSQKLFGKIEKYIDDNYVDEHLIEQESRIIESYECQNTLYSLKKESSFLIEQPIIVDESKRSLGDLVDQLDESFSDMLLRLIDEKGMTDVETYKKANMDRKLFSKIRGGNGYNPSKATAIALAIALRLNRDQSLDLLGKAGYTLSRSNKFDVIIDYFIQEENYNIHEINEALFAFDQMLLGA